MSQTNISFQDLLEVSTWCQLLGTRNIIKMCAVTCFYPSALRGCLAVFITQRAGGKAAWTPTCCEGNDSRMRQRSILKLTPQVYLLKMWISITSSSRSKSQFSENLVNALTPAWGDIFQITTAAMTKGLKTPVIRNKRVFKTGKKIRPHSSSLLSAHHIQKISFQDWRKFCSYSWPSVDKPEGLEWGEGGGGSYEALSLLCLSYNIYHNHLYQWPWLWA